MAEKVHIDEELKEFLRNSKKLEKVTREIAYEKAKVERMEREKVRLENAVLAYMLRQRKKNNPNAHLEIQRMGKQE